MLYASDAGAGGSAGAWSQADDLLNLLIEEWGFSALEAHKLRPAVSEFGRALCEEYLAHREDIDARIDRLSQGWTLERMPLVDRNLLRMAVAELLFLGDIPVGATIDEAVDLAKEYGTADSGKFVNGILGTVARELQEARKASPPGSTGFQACVPSALPPNPARASAAAEADFPLPQEGEPD